jgi:predicted metalloprotease with PDZ domain
MFGACNRLGSMQCFLAACGLMAAMVASHANGGEPSRAMLCVIPVDDGGRVMVKDVYVGGPAQVAGLRPGDRIIAVNDKAVNTAAELIETLAGYDANARVELRASRDGWSKQLPVTLAKRENVAGLPLSLNATPQSTTRRMPVGTSSPNNRTRIDSPFYRYRYQRW